MRFCSHRKTPPFLFFCLALLAIVSATPAFAQNKPYYVDCINGSDVDNGSGTLGSLNQPWRRLLQAQLYDASPGFSPGDSINLRSGCIFRTETSFSHSNGSPGSPITITTYGGTVLPFTGHAEMSGYLPISSKYWANDGGNVWETILYYVAAGSSSSGGSSLCSTGGSAAECVKCYGLTNACMDQPMQRINMVRFGKVWGAKRTSSGAMTQDRDWFFDTGYAVGSNCMGGCTQKLYVYCSTCTPTNTPDVIFGEVAPIAIGNQADAPCNNGPMLNLNGVQYWNVQSLLVDWFDGTGIQVTGGTADHIYLANVAANSMVENGLYVTATDCNPPGIGISVTSQYTQIGINLFFPISSPTDIHVLNSDTNMNYIGRNYVCPQGSCVFDDRNNRAYGNREYGMQGVFNNAPTPVVFLNEDYNHYYGNNLGLSLEYIPGFVPLPPAAPIPAKNLDINVTGNTFGPFAPGTHDIAPLTPPVITQYKRWPAYVTWTFDDPGLRIDSAPYFQTLCPLINALGITPSVAVVTGSDYSPQLVSGSPSLLQQWINGSGNCTADVVAHSVSHGYWAPPAFTGVPIPSPPPASETCSDNHANSIVPCDVFKIRYVGTIASVVTLTIAHTGGLGGAATLNIGTFPTDACGVVSWDLTPVAPGGTAGPTQINTVGSAISALQNRKDVNNQPCFALDTTAVPLNVKPGAHMYGLADVTTSITSQYALLFDESNFEYDEFKWSLDWMNYWLPGILPANRLAVMPASFLDPVTENILAGPSGIGYKGIRGTLASKPCCANTTTLANGYNVLDITSQGTFPNLENLSYRDMRNYMAAYVWKDAAWGNPMGFFQHVLELPPDQTQNEIKALQAAGATFESDTALMNLILGCYQSSITPNVGVGYTGNFVAGSFYTCPALATGKEMDFRPTRSSPTFNAGIPLGASFQYDINGINRTASGIWSIGAYDETNPPVPVLPAASLANRWCLPVANSFTGTINPLLVKDGPANPLQNCLYTEVSNTPSGGATHALTGGCTNSGTCAANLLTTYAAAACGDTITLDPAFTYNYSWMSAAAETMASKGCDDSHWITIETSQFANLPNEHTRISPCWANVPNNPGLTGLPIYACPIGGVAQILAKVIFGANLNSTNLVLAADHIRWIGLEITRTPGSGQITQYVDQTGSNSIIWDRNWIHGTSLDETRHTIQVQTGAKTAFINNYVSDIHCINGGACTQSTGIGFGLGTVPNSGPTAGCLPTFPLQYGNGTAYAPPGCPCQPTGTGPYTAPTYTAGCPGIYKVWNNFLEAAGENLFSGGGTANFVPVDFEIRFNHMFKPLFWNQFCATDPGGCGTPGAYLGTKFSVQNDFEMKNGSRVLFEDNILENSWGGFTQQGYAMLLSAANQVGHCPICYDSDMTVRTNLLTGTASGIQIVSVGDDTTGFTALGTERVTFRNIIHDGGFSDALSSNNALEMQFKCPAVMNDILYDHVSWILEPHSWMLMGTSTGACGTNPVYNRIVFTNNLIDAGAFPANVTSGISSINPTTLTRAGNVVTAFSPLPISPFANPSYKVNAVSGATVGNFNMNPPTLTPPAVASNGTTSGAPAGQWIFTYPQALPDATTAGTPLKITFNGNGCQLSSNSHSPATLFMPCFPLYGWAGNAVTTYSATYLWPALLKTFAAPSSLCPGASCPYANFNNGLGGDYHVTPVSGLQLAGTDGKDVGANVTLITTETAGVQ